jgi:uncharacterized protein DUF4410
MTKRAIAVLVACLLIQTVLNAGSKPQSGQMTNKDVIELKKAGLGDDVIILRMRSGPTNFTMNTSDIVALKSNKVSDDVIAEMVKLSASIVTPAAIRTGLLDLSNGASVQSFGSTITDPAAAGLPDATRTAVINILKSNGMFSAVGTLEEAKDGKSWVEITAELVDFAGGNVAKRMLIGLGTGRAHAGFSFTVKESATGRVLWKKTVKETASFWSNSASSSAQRTELPEKVAKSFVEQLMKARVIKAR